jgi:hypothetical protein
MTTDQGSAHMLTIHIQRMAGGNIADEYTVESDHPLHARNRLSHVVASALQEMADNGYTAAGAYATAAGMVDTALAHGRASECSAFGDAAVIVRRV